MKPHHAFICATAWKGSASAQQINALWWEAWQILAIDTDFVIPTASFAVLSDGGDGWLSAVESLVEGLTYQTSDWSVYGPVSTIRLRHGYLIDVAQTTLYIEAAQIHGLARLSEQGFPLDPEHSTSYGVGETLVHFMRRYPMLKQIWVSLGGSSSVDAGFGALQALGWRFYDAAGGLIPAPLVSGQLPQVCRIEPGQGWPSDLQLNLVMDVTTPFLEAPQRFGPQKGFSTTMIDALSQIFITYAEHPLLNAYHSFSGSGSAGGLAAALNAHAGMTTQRLMGSDWWWSQPMVQLAFQQCQWVLTGEGRLDHTTWLGKATGKLITYALKHEKSVWVMCGQIDDLNQWPEIIQLAIKNKKLIVMACHEPLSHSKEGISATHRSYEPPSLAKVLPRLQALISQNRS